MKPSGPIGLWMAGLLAVGVPISTAAAEETAAEARIERILDAIGVSGGMVVHLGCGDGKLTAALHVTDAYTVHGLDADPAKVTEARRYVRSLGIYGPVSIEQFSGSVLPYTDNLINLVVVQDPGDVAMDEIMRVLTLRGRPASKPAASGSGSSSHGRITSTIGGISCTTPATTRWPKIRWWARLASCNGSPRRCGSAATRRRREFSLR